MLPLKRNGFRLLAMLAVFAAALALSGCPSSDESSSTSSSESSAKASSPAPSADGEKGAVKQVSTEDEFNKAIGQQGKTVVDFFATWCPPCRQYSPILDKLAEEKLPGVQFIKVDVDKAGDLSQNQKIDVLPTTVIFENGKEVKRLVGVQSEADLRQLLKGSS